MNGVEVRVCLRQDLDELVRQGEPGDELVQRGESGDKLVRPGGSSADLAHHRERWKWQERGQAWYLLAWRDGVVAGRVTVLRESKYTAVRARYGSIWELNALAAVPQRAGTGTRLIAAAEEKTLVEGPGIVGLAFEPSNLGALRLYERLGYSDWGRGPILDEWTDRDAAARIIREHRTECRYLTKTLT